MAVSWACLAFSCAHEVKQTAHNVRGVILLFHYKMRLKIIRCNGGKRLRHGGGHTVAGVGRGVGFPRGGSRAMPTAADLWWNTHTRAIDPPPIAQGPLL